MPIHWTTILYCDGCKTTIRYEDERPAWRTERPSRRLVAKAKEFVRLNPQIDEWAPRPAYVGTRGFPFGMRATELRVPPPMRYVPCPACNAPVYRGSTPPDAVAEMTSAADDAQRATLSAAP